MTSCFSATHRTTIGKAQSAYHALGQRFRADLYVIHDTQPLLRPTE